MTTCKVRLVQAVAVILVWAGAPVAAGQGIYGTPGPWLDDRAQPFEMRWLQGEITVMTMAYGACRRVCSTSLRVMQQLQDLADARGVRLNFVVVGLDPTEDRPRDWAEFRVSRKLTRANWHFISGTPDATRKLASSLGLRYWRYGEHMVHDFRIVALSREGQWLRSIVAFDEDPAILLP